MDWRLTAMRLMGTSVVLGGVHGIGSFRDVVYVVALTATIACLWLLEWEEEDTRMEERS